eukprot:2498935-Pleurochrysis_carterae.AAC.2
MGSLHRFGCEWRQAGVCYGTDERDISIFVRSHTHMRLLQGCTHALWRVCICMLWVHGVHALLVRAYVNCVATRALEFAPAAFCSRVTARRIARAIAHACSQVAFTLR